MPESLGYELSVLIQAVNQTAEPFNDVSRQIEWLRDARIQANRVVFEQQRAEALLTQQFRYQYRAVYDSAELMTRVGSIGMTLLQITNSRALAELRLSDAVDGVAEAEEWAAKMLELYGENSVQYQAALEDLEEAHKDLKEAEDAHDMTEWSNFLTGVGVLGTSIQTIMKSLEFIKNNGGVAGMLGVATAIAPITIGITLTLGGLVGVEEYLGDILRKQIEEIIGRELLESDFPEFNKSSIDSGEYESISPGFYINKSIFEEMGYTGDASLNRIIDVLKNVFGNNGAGFSTTGEKTNYDPNDLNPQGYEDYSGGNNKTTKSPKVLGGEIVDLTKYANELTTSSTTKTIIQNNTIEVKQLTTVDDLGKLVSEIASITRQAAKEGY